MPTRSSSSALVVNGIPMPARVAMAARTNSSSTTENPAPAITAADNAALLTRGRGLLRDGDEWLQLEEALLADALHVHQLLDLLEAVVFLSVFDDALGRLWSDAGKRGYL